MRRNGYMCKINSGYHINGLEGVWGYLKRKLVSKGGIRREKLPLNLGEYVWRYNHRNENDNVKVKRIVKLLQHEVLSLESLKI